MCIVLAYNPVGCMCVDWASDKFAKHIIHTCGVHVCEFRPPPPPPPPLNLMDSIVASCYSFRDMLLLQMSPMHSHSICLLVCNVYTLMLTNHCVCTLNVRTDSVRSCMVPANSFKTFARFLPLLMRMHNEYLNNPDQLFNFIINYYSREPTGNHSSRSGTTNTI